MRSVPNQKQLQAFSKAAIRGSYMYQARITVTRAVTNKQVKQMQCKLCDLIKHG